LKKKYYVYRHIRLDTNTPFYVGKGKDKRCFSNKYRNKYWHNIVNSVGYDIEIMLDNLTEQEAITKEIEFIKLYKSLGYCEANMTDGGEGLSGYKHSDLTKKRWSEIRKGRPCGNKGFKMSQSQKQKISDALKGRKLSKNTRDKISASTKGKKRGPMSEKAKNNIKQAIIGKRQGKLNGMFGKKHSKETIDKIKAKLIGKKYPPRTEEYRKKFSKLKKLWWEKKKNDQL